MKKQSKVIIGITAGVLLIVVGVIVAVLMASGSDSKKYARHMESAQRYMDELDYEQAIAEYRAAIEIEPNNTEAYRALAELYVQTEDYESAIAVLNQGIEQTGSEELSEYIEEVQTEYEEQKALTEVAIQEEEPVAEEVQEPEELEQPENADEDIYNRYLEQAQELIDVQDYEQAIEVYETAIELLSEKEEAYLKLAELFVLMEDYESALDILNQGIEQVAVSFKLKSTKKELEGEVQWKQDLTWIEDIYDKLMRNDYSAMYDILYNKEELLSNCGQYEVPNWGYWEEKAYLLETQDGHYVVIIYSAGEEDGWSLEECIYAIACDHEDSSHVLWDTRARDHIVCIDGGNKSWFDGIRWYGYEADSQDYEEDEIIIVWHM